MNFIYYLERGKDLKGKSKKSRFFNFIKDTKWSYLTEYENYIKWFDNQLRTPEVHKGSILRRYFLYGSAPPDEKILGLINITLNAVWTNLLQIIQGEEPTSRFWNIAMKNC
jgi:hypothetical protein